MDIIMVGNVSEIASGYVRKGKVGHFASVGLCNE
jgi:hypothetical protein